MKEKLYKIVQEAKRPRIFAIYAGTAILVIGSIYFAKGAGVAAETGKHTAVLSETVSDFVSVVGESEFSGLNGNVGNSWPAEIISNQILQIQPQREGIVSDWRVRVGESVYQGQVLGKISAPPGTPELISMLSEQVESLAMAKATAEATNDYITKEQARLKGLEESLAGDGEKTSQVFGVLQSMRVSVNVKQDALRSFVERALADHVSMVTNVADWRYIRSGVLNRGQYGVSNQNIQNAYESALLVLAEKLKNQIDIPTREAQEYFRLAVQLANNSGADAADFKKSAALDQEDFLDFLSEYKEAQAELADKETEYRLMIREQGAVLEKEKAMAIAGLEAAEQAYSTVFGEIKGEAYIRAPRSGTISAIYKKIGDLVDPGTAIAVVAEKSNADLIARIRIPNNILKPKIGDVFSAIRPGFPNDRFEVKIVGMGSSLDETGSYMADAVFLKNPDWPVQSSVRILQPDNSISQVIASKSLFWDVNGLPYVWSVSVNDRIHKTGVKIGRVLGDSVEIYEGLKKGDRYVTAPSPEIRENMFLGEIVDAATEESGNESSGSGGHEGMHGM